MQLSRSCRRCLFCETPCAAAPSLPTPHARSLALFYGFSMVSIRSPCPSARISMKALRSSTRAIARRRSGLSNGGLSRFDDQIDAGIGWRCSTARQSRWRSPATARPCAYASTALYRLAESGRCVSKCQSCNLQRMRSWQWRQSPLAVDGCKTAAPPVAPIGALGPGSPRAAS